MAFTDRFICVPIIEFVDMEEYDDEDADPLFRVDEVIKQSTINISPFQIEYFKRYYGIDSPLEDDWQYTLIRTKSGRDILVDLRVEEFEVLLNTETDKGE